MRSIDVTNYRLRAHSLDVRRPAADLLAVAGACGVQDSPPGSALLALHARVEGVTRAGFDRMVSPDKSLLRTWSMRGAPFFVPTSDAGVFTAGVLPASQEARLHLVNGVAPALDSLGLGLDEAVDLASRQVRQVLSGRQLAIGELGRALADGVAGELAPGQRKVWRQRGPYAADQTRGEAVMHFCVRLLTLRGEVCMAPGARFVLLDQWLGRPWPQRDPQDCRSKLLRRYLRCYGPSTRADFAAWLGVRPGDADSWWTPLAGELARVEVDGRCAWILADDGDALLSPPRASGVRLLPPGDPYIQGRDRRTMVAPLHQRQVWLAVGSPGTVLADGAIVGTWRPRKRGRLLTLTVRTFGPLDVGLREQLLAEAEAVGALRGASGVAMVVEDAA